MKIAIVTDTHMGARDDSVIFNDYFIRFFNEQFFPYLEDNNIKTIMHLGDVFDRRKYANFRTLSEWNKHVFPKFNEYDTHIILGNHDVYFKNTNSVNSVKELLTNYNFKVYEEAETIELDGLKILLLPWINSENHEATLDAIKNTTAQVCMGHLEIQGFEMNAGHICEHGLSTTLFKGFDIVFSGHFHKKSKQGNIEYLGSPYPMNWSDWGDRRGFHIFDTSTREIEFIEFTEQIFHKIYYNDEKQTYTEITQEDYSDLKDKFVRIIVQKKTNAHLFSTFLEKLNKENPADVSVVESIFDTGSEEDEDVDQTKDTFTILKEYVDSTDIESKSEVIDLIHEIYVEALNTDASSG